MAYQEPISEITEPIYTRRSIRKFQKKEIKRELIERIVDAGRAAPSAKNRQPWKFMVYSGKAKQELLYHMKKGIEREKEHPSLPDSGHGIPDAENTLRIMESAPVIIMVLNTNGKSPFTAINADERFTEINDMLSIGAAVENMLLQAEALDVGTLWIGNTCFAYRELTEYIGTEAQLTGAVALGYKDEHPAKRPRKNLDDIVEYYN
ncbi:MAG: nitroreductase family protein [Lachnospiraceae bacterium]|nr:nitroreductase family protein [Lachnospiraceae bacterium]